MRTSAFLDFVVQQPAPVDSRVRDRFPELRADRPTRLDPILDYEDDLYPDFSVNFESSTELQTAVRRPQFVPQEYIYG